MKNIIKVSLVISIILILNINLLVLGREADFDEAKKLIDAKTSCNSLSDNQLELIGEYLMEQMHPGDAHEFMHNMMGLQEGSKEEEQFHINLAKAMYCGDNSNTETFSGMMGMSKMMGFGGMMNMGMFGNYGYGFGYSSLINFLYILLLVGLIMLVVVLIIKFWQRGAKK